MEERNLEPRNPVNKGNTPWERMGMDVVEYARLVKSVEVDIQKQADKIRWQRQSKKFENEPPLTFAGLGCIGWLIIVAMCFFVGYLFAQ